MMTRTKKTRRRTRKTTSRRLSGNRMNKTGPIKLEAGTQVLETNGGGWSLVLTAFAFVQSHQERKHLLRQLLWTLTARLQFLSDLSLHDSTPFCPRVWHLIQLVGGTSAVIWHRRR